VERAGDPGERRRHVLPCRSRDITGNTLAMMNSIAAASVSASVASSALGMARWIIASQRRQRTTHGAAHSGSRWTRSQSGQAVRPGPGDSFVWNDPL
jgi:hypothetical protein